MEYSIVIPTYNKLHDCLKPCIESIIKNTDMESVELVIVSNGCVDGTVAYLDNLDIPHKKILKFENPLGYTVATNTGIKNASGKFIILLNNDNVILDFAQKNEWIAQLRRPFDLDLQVAITGPAKSFHAPTSTQFMIFFCVMVSRAIFDELGYLDEVFNPGYGEDIDFARRVQNAGYKIVQVPYDAQIEDERTREYSTGFPIYHKSSQTVHKVDKWEQIVLRNESILASRYKKTDINIAKSLPKYTIVIPTYNHLEDCLIPCLESIGRNTDLTNTDIIIVANGCTDGTAEYLRSTNIKHRLIWHDSPLGFVKAVNLGISVANTEFIILLNNDTIITANNWISLLEQPFMNNRNLGASGPLLITNETFDVPCLMFFCVMIKSAVFQTVGLLDEEFGLGGGDDIDFCMRMMNKGYEIAQVPVASTTENNCDKNGQHFFSGGFPIIHQGSATFRNIDFYNNELVHVNARKIIKKYKNNIKLNYEFEIKRHDCFSVGMINSGAYFTLNDNQIDLRANSVKEIYAGNFVDFLSSDELNNVLDNWYTILQHDGEVYMDCRLFGKIIATKNNVLLLRRYAEKQSYKLIKYSIIIPSFNHLDDCLRPCIESIKKYTDLANTEIIVVANGCTDETKDYVEGLGKPFKLIWHAEPLGYAKPLNMGIRIAQGEFVIVLNNDIVLLPQNRNDWLRMLEEPFVNSHKAAASAPLKIHDSYANREILLSFCMMMRASALRRVGIFDESYGFGGGEDVDLCARFLDAGYTLHGVPDTTTYENGQSVGRFPIYHKSGASAADMESITDSKCKSQKNAIQNMIKYNKNIKLELYGKIDSYQQGDALIVNDEATKGNVLMDPLNLTFPRASVDEIRIGDTIDNFSDSEFACAVRNWLQTLKSGGRLIVDSTLLGSFIVTKV